MKKIMVITLAAMLVLSLGACTKKTDSGSASDSGKVFRIRYNGTLPDEHFVMQMVRKAATMMEQRSNGRLVVQVYPNNTLTDSRGAIEGMQNNTIQVGEMSTAPLAGFTDAFQPMSLPYFFASADECINYCKSDFLLNTIGDQVAQQIGVRIIGAFYNGPRSVSNSKRPIVTPNDVRGLKIRVMESPVYIKTWESWGGQPTPMSFAELFTGLQQGTIDGQDNGPTITVTNKYYEVQKYYSTIFYIHDVAPVMVSETFYKSLPEDLRTIFLDCFREVIDEQHKAAKESIEADLKVMESNGVTVTRLTDAQRTAFKEAASPVYDWFRKQYTKVDLDRYITEIK